jgi:hypothetical protein
LSTILQHQWASKLLSFDFTVEYKPGSSNMVVVCCLGETAKQTGPS